MQYRTFGDTGIQVSALGFGCGDVGGLMVRGPCRSEWTPSRGPWTRASPTSTRRPCTVGASRRSTSAPRCASSRRAPSSGRRRGCSPTTLPTSRPACSVQSRPASQGWPASVSISSNCTISSAHSAAQTLPSSPRRTPWKWPTPLKHYTGRQGRRVGNHRVGPHRDPAPGHRQRAVQHGADQLQHPEPKFRRARARQPPLPGL